MITKQHRLHSSKPKEFADDSFKFDENSRKFYKRVMNNVSCGHDMTEILLKAA